MEATPCRHVLGFDQDFVAAGFSFWLGHSRAQERGKSRVTPNDSS
jgi:hypothetical protein